MPEQDGRYIAETLETGLGEKGRNNLTTFSTRVRLLSTLDGNELEGVQEITAYLYIDKKDGSINTSAVEQIHNAYGWDGRDLQWLANQDFIAHKIQVTLGWETWDNKKRLKVQWIDAEDATRGPGIKRADDTEMRRINARLGPKLRAGAQSWPAPETQDKSSTQADDTKKDDAVAYGTEELSWGQFVKLEAQHGMKHKDVQAMFLKAVRSIAPGRDYAKITPMEWQRISQQALPF